MKTPTSQANPVPEVVKERLAEIRFRGRSHSLQSGVLALRKLQNSFPQVWQISGTRASLLLVTGHVREAQAAIAEAVSLGMPDLALKFCNALLNRAAQGSAAVELHLKGLLSTSPGWEIAALALADMLGQQRRLVEADEILSVALKANPANEVCRKLLLKSAVESKDFARIISLIELGSSAQRSIPNVMHYTMALLSTGREHDARRYMLGSVDLWPKSSFIIEHVGELNWSPDERSFVCNKLAEIGGASGDEVYKSCVLALLNLGRDDLAADLIGNKGDLEGRSDNALLHAILDSGVASKGASKMPSFDGGDMVVVARPGSKRCLLIFAGLADRLQLPMPLFHRIIAPLDTSVIYLRDTQRSFFLGGIAGLGSNVKDAVAALRVRIDALGANKIYTLGNSSGGFAAIRYGLELGASGIMTSGGLSNISSSFMEAVNDTRATSVISRVNRSFAYEELDLRPMLKAAKPSPRLLMYYGADHAADKVQAEYLKDISSVEIRFIIGHSGHGVLLQLIENGKLLPVLSELMKLRA